MKKLVSYEQTDEVIDEKIKIEYDVELDNNFDTYDLYAMPKFERDFTYAQLNGLEDEIDRLTSNADALDYIIAASSGVLTAAIDAVLKEKRIADIFGVDIGDNNIIDFFNKTGSEAVNDKLEMLSKSSKLKKAAKKSASAENSSVDSTKLENDSLKGIITFLEKRFNMPSDSLTSEFGGSKQHHLRDFAHHPSLVGLLCSLYTQFSHRCIGTDKNGTLCVWKLKFTDKENSRIAKADKEVRIIGKNTKEKFSIGIIVWYYHLISDMAGSSNTPGAGMGIPGPMLSLAKELSVLPIFKNKDGENKFSLILSKMYNGTFFAGRDENGKLHRDENNKIDQIRKIDFRTEMGIKKELEKQAIPVLINEAIVRSFYFLRRLFEEIKNKNIKSFYDLKSKNIDFDKVKPFNNRTVGRMITIASGSFVATNLAVDAAISAVKSAGNPAAFAKNFVMRINFAGVGRFAIAIGTDITAGIRKTKLENEYIKTVNSMTNETVKQIESQHIELVQGVIGVISGETQKQINNMINFLGENFDE